MENLNNLKGTFKQLNLELTINSKGKYKNTVWK